MERNLKRKVAEAMINDVFKMQEGEYLAITADQGSNLSQLEEYLEVCHERGIKCTILKTATPPGQSKAAEETMPVEATIQFLLHVDCWIDAGSKGLLYSDVFEAAVTQNKKLRYMLTADLSTEMLYDMYCSFEVDAMTEFTKKLEDMLNLSKTYTMRNADGTDITFTLEPNNFISIDNGNAGKPGVYTPPASVNVIPKTGTTNGIIACKAVYADPEPNFATESPVNIYVEDGVVVKIDGDDRGAAAMNKWYDKFAHDPNAHKIAHTMLGLLPSCREITGYVVMDERLYGGSCWGIGHVSAVDMPPKGQPSVTHFDVILEKVSVWLDDVQIMKDGVYIHPELKAIAQKMEK